MMWGKCNQFAGHCSETKLILRRLKIGSLGDTKDPKLPENLEIGALKYLDFWNIQHIVSTCSVLHWNTFGRGEVNWAPSFGGLNWIILFAWLISMDACTQKIHIKSGTVNGQKSDLNLFGKEAAAREEGRCGVPGNQVRRQRGGCSREKVLLWWA